VRPRVRRIGIENLNRSIFSLLFAHSWGRDGLFRKIWDVSAGIITSRRIEGEVNSYNYFEIIE
jgi:hypothetical protein